MLILRALTNELLNDVPDAAPRLPILHFGSIRGKPVALLPSIAARAARSLYQKGRLVAQHDVRGLASPMASNNHLESNSVLMKHITPPFVAAVAIIGYTASPLLKFADQASLFTWGGTLACGTFILTFGLLTDTGERTSKTVVFGMVVTLIGFIGMLVTLIFASQASDRTNFQCSLLERDMMAMAPSRTDSHDIYSALGCRQQMAGTLKFKPGGQFR